MPVMSAQAVERIETAINMIASTLIAAATGYPVVTLLRGVVDPPLAGGIAAACAILSYLLCFFALRKVRDRFCDYPMAEFTILPLEPIALDELVLTDADRVQPSPSAADEPLVLNDILAEIAPDSRVVRLFDRSAMPSPGQLKSRIDDHIGQGPAQSDASQALSDALAELRRSLR